MFKVCCCPLAQCFLIFRPCSRSPSLERNQCKSSCHKVYLHHVHIFTQTMYTTCLDKNCSKSLSLGRQRSCKKCHCCCSCTSPCTISSIMKIGNKSTSVTVHWSCDTKIHCQLAQSIFLLSCYMPANSHSYRKIQNEGFKESRGFFVFWGGCLGLEFFCCYFGVLYSDTFLCKNMVIPTKEVEQTQQLSCWPFKKTQTSSFSPAKIYDFLSLLVLFPFSLPVENGILRFLIKMNWKYQFMSATDVWNSSSKTHECYLLV